VKKKLAIIGLALVTVLDGVNHLTVERTGFGEGPDPDEFPRATSLVIGALALLPRVAGLAYHHRIRGPR